jgi:hypothetical protein
MKQPIFDIDEEIDIEVLANEQVYDNLRELEDLLEEGYNQRMQNMNMKLTKSKKKR